MKKQFIIFVLIAVIAGGLGAYIFAPKGGAGATAKESAYDRVVRTNTLRCGYALFEPMLIKNPTTGQMSGMFYDYVEALGEALNLKIEWAEEIGYGDMITALETGRIDAFCSDAWLNAKRGRSVDFTIPIVYSQLRAVVRAGDTRFDNNIARANAPDITVSTVDGEMASVITARDFPKAKTLELPQLVDFTQMLLNIADGKADITFTDTYFASAVMEKNPGRLRFVKLEKPMAVYANALVIPKDYRLKSMLDIATTELTDTDVMDKILSKYEKYPGALLRINKPYKLKNQ